MREFTATRRPVLLREASTRVRQRSHGRVGDDRCQYRALIVDRSGRQLPEDGGIDYISFMAGDHVARRDYMPSQRHRARRDARPF
jgi:hypothetical protein